MFPTLENTDTARVFKLEIAKNTAAAVSCRRQERKLITSARLEAIKSRMAAGGLSAKQVNRLARRVMHLKPAAQSYKRYGFEDIKFEMNTKNESDVFIIAAMMTNTPVTKAYPTDKLYAEYETLHYFRKVSLSKYSRAVYLAYAFTRGIPYTTVERSQRLSTRNMPDWNLVYKVLNTMNCAPYGTAAELSDWIRNGTGEVVTFDVNLLGLSSDNVAATLDSVVTQASAAAQKVASSILGQVASLSKRAKDHIDGK